MVEGVGLGFRGWVGFWYANMRKMNGNGTPNTTDNRRACALKPRLRVDPQGVRRLKMGPDFRTKQK